MGRGASPRRRACAARAGLGAIACALTTLAATPAFAQAPALELDVEAPVEQAAEPVEQAAQMAVQVAEPVTQATEPVSEATEALVRTAEPVVKATEPLVDATAPALDAAKPAVRLSAPTVPITNLARDLTQPERGPQPLRQRAQQGSEGSQRTFGGSARRGSGGPPNAGSATTALVFDGPNPVSPTVPAGTAEDPVVPAAPRRHPAAPAAQRRVGTPGSAPMMVEGLPQLTPEIVTTAAPADSTTSPSSRPGSASPDRQPAPAPFGSGAGAAAGAAGAAAPVLALLVLLLLAAPSLSRFLRTVPAFLRPAPFICALERPG